MFFEDLKWGWKQKKIDKMISKTDVYMHGGEVYITHKDGKTQNYFKDLSNKKKNGLLRLSLRLCKLY
jgi:hypothetical protein